MLPPIQTALSGHSPLGPDAAVAARIADIASSEQHFPILDDGIADDAAVCVTNLTVGFGNANANANTDLAKAQPAQEEKSMAMTSSQARPSFSH